MRCKPVFYQYIVQQLKGSSYKNMEEQMNTVYLKGWNFVLNWQCSLFTIQIFSGPVQYCIPSSSFKFENKLIPTNN